MTTRKASVVWNGGGKDGAGKITTASGVLKDSNYGFKSRFESGPGTNPEELIAAAHAGCFSMALAFALEAAGHTAEEIDVEVAVTLVQDGQGFKISRSDLTLKARVPGLDDAQFRQIAEAAHKNCPVSKVLNAESRLDAVLDA
ncbi:MAG TPA: OsmC family protein [Caulobacteraceae bacterium]|jgi:osmotically inducible protein OsmC